MSADPLESNQPTMTGVPVPRLEVLETPPAYHGAMDYAELEALGIDPHGVLDFSVNGNPFGPSPTIAAALAAVPLDRYPDRDCLALRRALAARLHVSLPQIVIGNGSAELLWLIACAFLTPARRRRRERVVVIGPTFGEHSRVSRLMGAQVCTWAARPETGFAVDERAVADLLDQTTPRIVFVCNPNNPTGTVRGLDAIARWAAGRPSVLFVIDEAYLAFGKGLESALTLGAPNMLVLRSMTKDYALAGLRVGYAVGPERLVEAVTRVRPAWNANSLAQAAALAALADEAHLQRSLAALAEAKPTLVHELQRLGWDPVPSAAHFMLLDVGHGASFRADLLRRGILVRDCASFGLPRFVRIAARRPDENARLLAVFKDLRERYVPGVST